MIYKIMLGLISIIFGYYVYQESGLADPMKTLGAAVFFGLSAAVFLDSTEETGDLEDE